MRTGTRARAFAAGDIPNIQTLATKGRTNEGQIVLTNGMNVGARNGSPDAPGGPGGPPRSSTSRQARGSGSSC